METLGRLRDALIMGCKAFAYQFKHEWEHRQLRRVKEHQQRKAYEEVWSKLEQEAMDLLAEDDREFIVRFMVMPEQDDLPKFKDILAKLEPKHAMALVKQLASAFGEELPAKYGLA